VITHWDEQPTGELAAYAHRTYTGNGITQWIGDPPEVFESYARHLIEKVLNYTALRWHFWVTVCNPVADPSLRWMPLFPHNHGYDGITLVQYLEVPEEGGQLVIFNDDLTIKREVTPKVGDGAILVDHEIHGVRAVHGSTPRTVLIAGAYPYPLGTTKCRCPWTGPVYVNTDPHWQEVA
jgi:hypothetical protein